MNFQTVLYYKLAIVRGILYSLGSLISTFVAAVLYIDFPAMHHWDQFLICLAVLGSWITTMIAFLDRTTAKLAPLQIEDRGLRVEGSKDSGPAAPNPNPAPNLNLPPAALSAPPRETALPVSEPLVQVPPIVPSPKTES